MFGSGSKWSRNVNGEAESRVAGNVCTPQCHKKKVGESSSAAHISDANEHIGHKVPELLICRSVLFVSPLYRNTNVLHRTWLMRVVRLIVLSCFFCARSRQSLRHGSRPFTLSPSATQLLALFAVPSLGHNDGQSTVLYFIS